MEKKASAEDIMNASADSERESKRKWRNSRANQIYAKEDVPRCFERDMRAIEFK